MVGFVLFRFVFFFSVEGSNRRSLLFQRFLFKQPTQETTQIQLEADVAKFQHHHEQSESLCASLRHAEELTRAELQQTSEEFFNEKTEKQRLQQEVQEFSQEQLWERKNLWWFPFCWKSFTSYYLRCMSSCDKILFRSLEDLQLTLLFRRQQWHPAERLSWNWTWHRS